MRVPLTAVVCALLGAARPAIAVEGPGKGRAPQKPKAEEPKDVRLRAETQELVEKNHYHAQGFVDLQMGETRVQSDVLDLYITDRPDGTQSRRVVAQGNAVFLRGDERIAGERLDMDLETGVGTFTKAVGYVQPGVFVEADTIERLDPSTYRVQGAKFTSCSQPNPRWSFSASSAKIHVDDKIVGKNVLFKVKSVPAFYVPVFLYPIRDDQRSTGFVFPHFGYSGVRGFVIGDAFFWAMGRSFDQTFYYDNYSKFGYGVGHEFRYAGEQSRGTFHSYFLHQAGKAAAGWDYDLDYNAIQMLPARFRAAVQVRRYSNLVFQKSIQDNLNQASIRNRRGSVSVQRSFGANTLQLVADSNETFFERADGSETLHVTRHLPTLRLSRFSQRIGRTPLIFGFEARAEELGLGDEATDRSGNVAADSGTIYRFSRLDVAPELSVSGGTTYLQLTPRAQVRYTRYGKSDVDPDDTTFDISGPPIDRRYFEGSLEMRGPMFSRIFNNPGNWYTDKFKHVIGPVITYRYRTKVDQFAAIPKFDGFDQSLGTNEIEYALEQHFFARRPGPGGIGKPSPYEFLTWRLLQTYYIDIKNNQNEFDPNYSSAAFVPGGTPDHNSPIRSDLRFRPTPRLSSNFQVEYDVNFKQLRRLSLSSTLTTPPFTLQAGWTKGLSLNVNPAKRLVLSNTLQGSARIQLVPGLEVDGSGYYDIEKQNLLNSRVRLRYDVQCCGFVAEMIQFNFAERNERQFRFSIELANIGSVGSFNGDGMRSGPGGLYNNQTRY